MRGSYGGSSGNRAPTGHSTYDILSETYQEYLSYLLLIYRKAFIKTKKGFPSKFTARKDLIHTDTDMTPEMGKFSRGSNGDQTGIKRGSNGDQTGIKRGSGIGNYMGIKRGSYGYHTGIIRGSYGYDTGNRYVFLGIGDQEFGIGDQEFGIRDQATGIMRGS